jgi:protein TonB
MNYSRQQKDPTKQAIGFLVVIVFHVGLVYALVNGLGKSAIEVLKKPMETKLIEEVKPPDAPPPPPPPKLAPPPPPFIPMPDIQVRTAAPNAITQVTHDVPKEPPPPPAPAAPPPPPHVPVVVAAVIDANTNCRKPEYPSVSLKLQETGTTELEFVVEADGTVAESKVTNSSGHPRLDEAARSAMAACKFKPGTIDGKPQKLTTRLRWVWKLTD